VDRSGKRGESPVFFGFKVRERERERERERGERT